VIRHYLGKAPVVRTQGQHFRGSIAGVIRLEQPEELDDALLIVALHDVTYIDAPSRVMAERRYGPISGLHAEIPFCLAVPATISRSASYSFKAEIRRSDPTTLCPGDYLSTAAHPWVPGDANAVIVVKKI
jgi:uncharacterized lipoprotein YbaY